MVVTNARGIVVYKLRIGRNIIGMGVTILEVPVARKPDVSVGEIVGIGVVRSGASPLSDPGVRIGIDDIVGDEVIIIRAGRRVKIAASHQYAAALIVEDGVVDDVDVIGVVPEMNAISTDIVDDIVFDITGGGLIDALDERTAGRPDVMDDVADRVDVGGPVIAVERDGTAA